MKADSAQHELRAINASHYLCDEDQLVETLLQKSACSPALATAIRGTAEKLVVSARQRHDGTSGLQAFLQHYDLSSHEGLVLMCIAEALLRTPDAATMDALISDRLNSARWSSHLGESDSLFVNASTWALMLGAQGLRPGKQALDNPAAYLRKLVRRMEEPVVRAAMKSAMGIMARQFVMGRSIKEALQRSVQGTNKDYRFSFDMLGEAAITEADALRYFQSYADAITAIGNQTGSGEEGMERAGISIKLSALYPRYESRHEASACEHLSQGLLELARLARDAGIGLTVDAEEADRLEMCLLIFAKVYNDPAMKDWEGLGIAVQAYQKRALPVLAWLNRLSRNRKRRIPLRLVKGAYWDTEIKLAQQQGLRDYPVFTRKTCTDISYQACTHYLLRECEFIYPQFATHNARTLAYVYHHAGDRDYEFQRLHGMGEELYAEVIDKRGLEAPCRVYAPVGAHEDLLPYLVRRLLENGANTSFVNQMTRHGQDMKILVEDPVEVVRKLNGHYRHANIPLPAHLFGKRRRNSEGLNIADKNELEPLMEAISAARHNEPHAVPCINGQAVPGQLADILNPATGEIIGKRCLAGEADLLHALDGALKSWHHWNGTAVRQRAKILEQTADLYEQNSNELVTLCIREAGKTIFDALAELREAVDFLRYYAHLAKKTLARRRSMPGPTGESNTLGMQGRGVFLCISPWNFPLAIFTGQIAAALVSGNTVLAKPAEQSSLVAAFAAGLFHQAGLPAGVLQFVPADGVLAGDTLLRNPDLAGVAFTGSTLTARKINRLLAQGDGPIARLIAETGGQNAMIADSTALPEQLVTDVVESAFYSAGQRCSALRVLYLQADIADRIIGLLQGHMDELCIGDPADLETDIGPVIDKQARDRLLQHIDKLCREKRLIHRCHLSEELKRGYFVAPTVFEIDNLAQLENENFGPVLHLVRYDADRLDDVVEEINGCGYGLTLGIHSRIEARAEYIRDNVRAGNVYVNRNMTGAVVGVQPFGGMGLSGTGPKAGGPNYLQAFCTEQTFSVNTSAIGGNASLLAIR